MARPSNIRFYALILALLAAQAGGLTAPPNRSLSDLDLEAAEARVALEKALEENAFLKEQVTLSEARAARMTESIAIANGEAEVFRRQAGELKLRLEALGLAGAGGDSTLIEQRLLRAVSDLRLVDDERKKLKYAMLEFSEAALRFAKVAVSPDAEARAALEAQLRRVNDLLEAPTLKGLGATPTEASLVNGTVISIKEDLNLIVANVGLRQGVQVGMPFQVLREGHLIGTVRVIDAREKIAGAVIQNLSSEKERIKVGDHLKVDAQP